MLRHVHVLLATKWILRKEGKISMLEQQQEIQQQCNNISNNRKYHNTRRLNTRKLFDFYVQYSYIAFIARHQVSTVPCLSLYHCNVSPVKSASAVPHQIHSWALEDFCTILLTDAYDHWFLSWASKQRTCECLWVSVVSVVRTPLKTTISQPHSFIFPRETQWRWWWWQYLGCNFIFFSFLRSVLY